MIKLKKTIFFFLLVLMISCNEDNSKSQSSEYSITYNDANAILILLIKDKNDTIYLYRNRNDRNEMIKIKSDIIKLKRLKKVITSHLNPDFLLKERNINSLELDYLVLKYSSGNKKIVGYFSKVGKDFYLSEEMSNIISDLKKGDKRINSFLPK